MHERSNEASSTHAGEHGQMSRTAGSRGASTETPVRIAPGRHRAGWVRAAGVGVAAGLTALAAAGLTHHDHAPNRAAATADQPRPASASAAGGDVLLRDAEIRGRIADWARENHLTGLSPESLRPTTPRAPLPLIGAR
jgi:hypothetical protein